MTLSQPATVSPGDVTVTGITGGSYGPVTISGSGTSTILITFAKAITTADRVTITIGNSEIINYTRRLDVLPGDVNDDGGVNTTDGVLILNNETPAHPYNVFDDLNGDGAVTTADFTLDRSRIGTVLPKLPPPQLAAGGEGPGGAAPLAQSELAPVLTAAIADWAAAGLPARDVARLRGVAFEITELPAGYLGDTAIGGSTVYLSADASGWGWFTDPSPWNNRALARRVAATELVAGPSTAPAGHEDLLTVVLHELGHTLGLSDLDPITSSADLMAETLATGVRRLPSAEDVARVIAGEAASPPAAMTRVPTRVELIDALFGAADEEAIGLLPASSMARRSARPENKCRLSRRERKCVRGSKGDCSRKRFAFRSFDLTAGRAKIGCQAAVLGPQVARLHSTRCPCGFRQRPPQSTIPSNSTRSATVKAAPAREWQWNRKLE